MTERGKKAGRDRNDHNETLADEAKLERVARIAELKRILGLVEERKRVQRNAQARMSRRALAAKRRAAAQQRALDSSSRVNPSKSMSPILKRSSANAPPATKRKKVAKDYRRPPRDRFERLCRHFEQRQIARQNGLDWSHLTSWEQRKRVRFGTNARCRNASDARALARITGKIAHGREKIAVSKWRLRKAQQAAFDVVCGFRRPPSLIASNKLVRVEATRALAERLTRFFRSSPRLHFYFMTIINDGWHTRHDDTEINLDDIHVQISRVLEGHKLDWLGMVEIDIFNNYPNEGKGLWITPHGHLFIWSRKPIQPKKLAKALTAQAGFSSALTGKPFEIESIKTARDIAHLCFYVTKPNYQVKAVGRENTKTEKSSVYTVEKAVRPSHTLRIAEILSYFSFPDLILAGGGGVELRRKWLRSLHGSIDRFGGDLTTLWDPYEFWTDIKPTRSSGAPIRVMIPEPDTRKNSRRRLRG